MATKVIEIIHRETIKPSTPTPHDLKIHKLSLVDQSMPVCYTPILLFYSAKNGDTDDQKTKSEKLRTSLVETLTHLYPLTGRLKDNLLIECEDQGAEYIEARIRCSLSDILKKPDAEFLDQFQPAAMISSEAATGTLLLVQATFFDCGGLAIGVCISHKIADAATLAQFVKFWSGIAIGSDVVAPVFMADSMFPPIKFSVPEESMDFRPMKCVTKRFVFTGPKIDALKEKVASETSPNPTRVEAVTGIIWKGSITALNKSNPNSIRPPYLLSFAVNWRPRFNPPVKENYIGNLAGSVTPKVEEEMELKGVVAAIKKEMQLVDNLVKKLQGEDGAAVVSRFFNEVNAMVASSDKINLFICSAWCRFGFYNVDFGWGKPIWVSTMNSNLRNFCFLLDTKDGEGIEAWITLSEEDMSLLEHDEEILHFARVNPSVTY
ncbi:HXXXD-type acyl-transferase family protein [Euphorbia peplus]|nr:HXXXD-type acyl-transferase family protein [Euphorbia peplus]